MDHDEYRDSSHHSKRMPTLFTVFEPVSHDHVERIIPHVLSQLE